MYKVQPLRIKDDVISNYEIDTDGHVFRTYKSGVRKEIHPLFLSNRYPFVYISNQGEGKFISLAKLMLYNFSTMSYSIIDACQIEFKDKNHDNVCINNLDIKRRKDGTMIRQPRVIQNVETGEILTATELAARLKISLPHVSKYITSKKKLHGQLWIDYLDDIDMKDRCMNQ